MTHLRRLATISGVCSAAVTPQLASSNSSAPSMASASDAKADGFMSVLQNDGAIGDDAGARVASADD